MNLYAVRDRMIDYFIQPFAAPGDHEVLAAIAARINQPGDTDAITQAPHHFEIWRVARFNQDTGVVEANKEFLADCSNLVRASVRTEQRPADRAAAQPPATRTEAPGGDQRGTGLAHSPVPEAPSGEALQAAHEHQGSGGSDSSPLGPRDQGSSQDT